MRFKDILVSRQMMNVDEDVISNSRLVDYVYLTIRWIDIIFDSRLKLLWSVCLAYDHFS
jgi:hypothetical protein